MWPRLDHVLILAKCYHIVTESPSLLRGHGEVCTAPPRRCLPDVQPAPILNEPAQNPPNRRRSGSRTYRRRQREMGRRPAFYNTEPDASQYGWIPGQTAQSASRERRRYR
eukprot:s672_g22.t1